MWSTLPFPVKKKKKKKNSLAGPCPKCFTCPAPSNSRRKLRGGERTGRGGGGDGINYEDFRFRKRRQCGRLRTPQVLCGTYVVEMTGNKRRIGGVADQNARKKTKKQAPHAPTPLWGRPHHEVWDCEPVMLDQNEQEYLISPLRGASKQSSSICCLIINHKNRPQNVFPYAHSPESLKTPRNLPTYSRPSGEGGNELTQSSESCYDTSFQRLSV